MLSECCYAECHYAECRYAECRYAECRYAECHYAECRYVECRYADCCGAIISYCLRKHHVQFQNANFFILNRNGVPDFKLALRMIVRLS